MLTGKHTKMAGLISRVEMKACCGGVHEKLHISSTDWWDLLLPLA